MKLHHEHNAYRISLPTGNVYDADEPGTFEVPEDVGRLFIGRPGWHEGSAPRPEVPVPARKRAQKPQGAASGTPIAERSLTGLNEPPILALRDDLEAVA